MPVPSQESRLLSLITTKGSGVYQRIQDYLDQGHPLPDRIPPHAWKQLCFLLKQALMQPGDESMKADKAWVILSLLQQLGTELDAPTLELACNSGLTVMISDCLSFVSECLYGKSSDTAEHFLEDLFDLITNIADRNAAVKEILLANFAIKMFQMILLQKYSFSIRLETLKGLNLLLDRCSLKARTALTSQGQVQELMKKAAFLVTPVGDYEFQVGLTEALFRLTQKDTRIKCAKKWFKNDIIVHSFANVRDAEFETDCRMFLNVLNGMPGEETMVLSYPCVNAFLANYKLLKPNDENYTDFWVDFNLGSKRITLFCNQDDSGSQFDESLWETVAIWQENVKTCAVNCVGDLIKVRLELTCNAKELISFGNIDGNIVSVEFDAKFPVEAVLVKLYGRDRVTGNQDQVAVRRASVPTTPMSAQSLDDSSKKGGLMQNTFPESSMMSSQGGSQNGAPRLKISIPVLPMTPRQVLEGSLENKMDGSDTRTPSTTQKKTEPEEKDITTATTPKTPTGQTKGKGKTPKRVKTPLVILTREEVESAASTSRKRDTPKTSGQNSAKNDPGKMSMPDTAAHKHDAAFVRNGEMSPELPQVAEPLNSSKLSDKSQIRHSGRQSAKKDTRSTRKKLKNKTEIDDNEGFMIPSSVPDEPIVVPDSQPFDTVLREIHESIKHFDADEQKIQEDKDGQEQTVHSTTASDADLSSQSKKSQTKQTEDADLPEGEVTRYRISHSPALSTVTEESSVTSSQDAKLLPQQNKTTPLQPIEEETHVKDSKGKNSGNRKSQAKSKPTLSTSTRQLRSRKKDTEPKERGAHDTSVVELLPAQKQPKSKQTKQVKGKQTKQKDVPNRDSQEDPFGFTETPVQDSVPTTISQDSNSVIPDTGTCEASNAPKVQPKFFKSRARQSDSSQVGGSKRSLYDYESHLAAVQNRKPARPKAKKGKGPQQKPRSKRELSPAEDDFHTAITNTSGRISTERERKDSPPNISSYELSITHREAEVGASRIVSQTCASSPSVYDDEEEFEDVDSPAQQERPQLQEKTNNKKQQAPRRSTEIVLETNISEPLVSKATEQAVDDQTDRERKQTPKYSAVISAKKHEPKSRRKSTHVDKEKEDKVTNSLTASVKSQKKQRKKEEADDRNADISTNNLEDSVSHFTNVCKKLLRKTKKTAVYKDISRSDIDMDTSTDISVTVTSTKKRQPLKPIQNEMNNITPAPTKTKPRKASKESKKKKSVFSETEDATDSRSEISWLVSTAKRKEKEKAKPKKTYTHKGKFTLYKPSMLGSHDDVNISSLFNDDDVTVPESKSMPPQKRKQLYETLEEPLLDHHEDISYKPDSKKKRQAQQKRKQSHESVKEPSSDHNEALSYRPDQKKKRPSKSPGQTSSHQKKKAKSPHEPPASRESFVDKLMSRLDVKTAHTPITPSVSVKTPKSTGLQSIPDDLSIEELRIEDAWSQPTPALQLDLSPMVLDEVYQQKKHTPGSSRKKCQSDKLSMLSKEFSPLPSVTPKSHKISSQDITRDEASSAESENEEEDQVHQAPDQQNDNDLLRSGHANRSKNRKPNPHRVKPCSVSSDSESEEMDLSQSSFLQPRRLFETGSPVAVKLASSPSSSEGKQEEEEEDEEEVEIEDLEPKHYHHVADSSGVQTGITSLLKSFSSDLQRSVLAKRQKLEMFTKGTAKATQRQINNMWTKQNTVRQNILDDFEGLLICEMRELEKEVNHMKEAEDKTLAFFQEQHKVMQACRSSQEQRIKRLCRIQENFISEIEETEDQHTQQQATMRDILRREMHGLQKKILFSSQQNEIRNVKKALQSLIL